MEKWCACFKSKNNNLPLLRKPIKITIMLMFFSIISISNTIQVFADSDGLADFVDPNKDPQHYLERYYNESKYKSWFDRNYPDITIEEAVGIISEKSTTTDSILEKNIIQEADAAPVHQDTTQKNNSEIAQMILALGGLGILFGAVYGVKRKVNYNTRQISINKETIKNKIIKPITRSNPLDIIQIRLAKGEITIEEFEKLESKLNKDT